MQVNIKVSEWFPAHSYITNSARRWFGILLTESLSKLAVRHVDGSQLIVEFIFTWCSGNTIRE